MALLSVRMLVRALGRWQLHDAENEQWLAAPVPERSIDRHDDLLPDHSMPEGHGAMRGGYSSRCHIGGSMDQMQACIVCHSYLVFFAFYSNAA